jgi:sarcosine oxidase subunit beta
MKPGSVQDTVNGRVDVIIIGAGIIGASIAFELSKRGYKTLNIDKQPAAGYGSTANSCAVIRTHYSTFQGTALAYENVSCWKNWGEFLGAEDELGLARYRETGVLVIKRDDSEIRRFREHHEALGIPYENWSLEQLADRMPFLDLRSFGPPRLPDAPGFGEPGDGCIPGALYLPVGGYVNDPLLAAHNLQRAAEHQGARFRLKAEVCGIRQAKGRVCGVTLGEGENIDAPVVINAAGPHSFQVNEMAGVAQDMNIRTRPMRHEVHYTPAPEGIDYDRVGAMLSDDDIGGYSRPEVGNKLLIGSLDPPCDPQEWEDDPDNFDREVSGERWEAQVYRMALRMPDLPIPTHPSGIADLYDVSDDWIPVYDRSDLPGFYMAVGTSGNQFKNAPVVGRMMAELVEACESGHDHDTRPVTFKGEHTGATFDLGFYSRLREVNTDSSFSVLG